MDWFPFGARVVLAGLATSKGGAVSGTVGRAFLWAEGGGASQAAPRWLNLDRPWGLRFSRSASLVPRLDHRALAFVPVHAGWLGTGPATLTRASKRSRPST